jgi:phosphohistidine phosphatase SixA
VNKGLTPKERVMRTIKRQDIDCLPTQIDFSGACLDKMLKYWDLANELDAVAFLGNHVVYAYLNDAVGNIKARQLAGDEISYDSWGVGYNSHQEGPLPVIYPLADLDRWSQYQFPNPNASGLLDRAEQRNLNDSGKSLAKAFGEAFRRVGIPVGRVYTSKFNRAYETAVLAGFKNIEKTTDLTEGGLVVSPNENNRRAEAFRKMIAIQPEPGTNTVLITHKPNIVDALGKDWFDVKEGEASIFRPENGRYTLFTRVQMADWSRIAAAGK